MKRNLFPQIVPCCNGSKAISKIVSLGSNPSGTTITHLKV